MYWFSKIITTIFDLLVAPFGGQHHSLVLTVLSALTGVGMIFIFKATSNQERIKETRDKFKARILEMRIYQDDVVLINKALWAALATNIAYLRVSLKPILVLVACVVFVFIQLDERFGRRPLEAGEKILLTVTLKDGVDPMSASVALTPSEGLAVDSRPVRAAAERQVHWRLRVDSPGAHHVDVTVDGQAYRLPVHAEMSNSAIGHIRTAGSFFNPLLFPSLPMISDDSPLEAVELFYPSAEYPLFVWNTHWLWVFVVYSLVGALVFKFLFGIEV